MLYHSLTKHKIKRIVKPSGELHNNRKILHIHASENLEIKCPKCNFRMSYFMFVLYRLRTSPTLALYLRYTNAIFALYLKSASSVNPVHFFST